MRSHLTAGLLLLTLAPVALAQTIPTPAAPPFVPGGRELFVLDFSQQPAGAIPTGLKYLRGPLDVVQKDGQQMLRSTGPTEFLITLPEVLPQSFTQIGRAHV